MFDGVSPRSYLEISVYELCGHLSAEYEISEQFGGLCLKCELSEQFEGPHLRI